MLNQVTGAKFHEQQDMAERRVDVVQPLLYSLNRRTRGVIQDLLCGSTTYRDSNTYRFLLNQVPGSIKMKINEKNHVKNHVLHSSEALTFHLDVLRNILRKQ